MIDYKNNFIFNLLQPGAFKKFGSISSSIFYDKRTKTAFRKIFAAPKPFSKYYFTDTTMERVKAIDLSNCYPTKLGYLFEKYGSEVGICICKENNLAFVYIIGATDIQLIVTSGTKKSSIASIDDFGNISYAALMKTIVGACVISYHKNAVDVFANNTLGMMLSKSEEAFKYDPEEKRELLKIHKELHILPEGWKVNDLKQNETPCLLNALQDLNIKSDKIWIAIKMFIFLKTAKVIEQNFISENKIYGSKSKSKQDDSNGIIVVDSTWNNSIHVVNPFSVSGHFRDQPKKNKENEWYKELIYIDSYMKTGYHRNAKSVSGAVS